MAKGISLHLGLDAVDPVHYQGWSGELRACEFDANDMQLIANAAKFESNILLTKLATRQRFFDSVTAIAKRLKAGDIFLLTYSGHGGQMPDLNNDEDDQLDETWCLYDGEVIDDEIYSKLSEFTPGVRILSFSDSCHSGSVLKANMLTFSLGSIGKERYRAMPDSYVQRTYLANKEFYDRILTDKKIGSAKKKIKASGIMISGCQDNQLSADGLFNGRFTGVMKSVWNGGTFDGTYRAFHKQILKRMPSDQTPNFFMVGPQNADFENQRPFGI